MKKSLILSVFVLFLVIMASSAFAYDVIVFEDYETVYSFKEGKLNVDKHIVLKNVGNNPIIPGELHFRIFEMKGDKQIPAKVSGLSASDNNNPIKTSLNEYNQYSDLVLHVWNPVLPGYDVPISLSYEVDFKAKGILFNELQFPIEETTIPIKSSSVKLLLPKKYHVSYAPSAALASDEMYNIVSWKNKDDLAVEYTLLPFPRMPFRMVSVFWLTVLVILGAVFIFLNMKRKKK